MSYWVVGEGIAGFTRSGIYYGYDVPGLADIGGMWPDVGPGVIVEDLGPGFVAQAADAGFVIGESLLVLGGIAVAAVAIGAALIYWIWTDDDLIPTPNKRLVLKRTGGRRKLRPLGHGGWSFTKPVPRGVRFLEFTVTALSVRRYKYNSFFGEEADGEVEYS